MGENKRPKVCSNSKCMSDCSPAFGTGQDCQNGYKKGHVNTLSATYPAHKEASSLDDNTMDPASKTAPTETLQNVAAWIDGPHAAPRIAPAPSHLPGPGEVSIKVRLACAANRSRRADQATYSRCVADYHVGGCNSVEPPRPAHNPRCSVPGTLSSYCG